MDETRIRAEDYWFNINVLLNANSFFATRYAGYIYNTFVAGSIMKSFRENQYQGFLRTRKELLVLKQSLNFKVDYIKWDTDFVNHANEYILIGLKNKRTDIVKEVLNDATYVKALKNYIPNTLHAKLIKFFIVHKMKNCAITIFKIWSLKLK